MADDMAVDDDVFVVETSLAQRSLWFVNEMDPGLPVYNVTGVVRIRGPLRPELLERALNVVVSRHEILRTTFELDAGEPVQVIRPETHVSIPVSDVREDDVPRVVNEEVERPFELAHGPLLRMRLLRVAEDEHVAVLVMHHIITDGWSSVILFSEISTCYEAFLRGREPELAPLPIQFADYAVWENDTLRGEALEEQIGYWSGRLADLAPLRLPPDHDPRPEPSFQGDVVTFALPDGIMADVNRLAREHGGTPFVVLLAAWQALLARTSGQYDVAVACPVAGRERPETAGLIGYFVNTVIMRTALSGDMTFLRLLETVRTVSTGALRHQRLPFGKVVEALRPQRHTGPGTPFARVLFVLQTAASESWQTGDLTMEPTWTPTGTAKFEVTLTIEPAGDGGHRGAIEYSTELYARATMERLAAQYLTLLRAAIDDPGRTLSRLPLLTGAERAALLRDGRALPPGAGGSPVQRLVADRARQDPGAAALTVHGVPVTYRELTDRAGRVARRLAELAPPRESEVTVLLDDPVDLLAASLGVLAAGCAVVPGDPADPADPTHVADPARPAAAACPGRYGACVVTSSAFRDRTPGQGLVIIDELPAGPAGPSRVPATDLLVTDALVAGVPVSGDRLALVDPLSGGMYTHAGLAAGAEWPPAPPERPTLMRALAALAEGTVPEVGELTRRPAAALADSADSADSGAGGAGERACPVGADVYVLDERMEPVPIGVPGELYLGGPALARGAWCDQVLTAQRFVADPHARVPGGRLCRTGEVVRRRADGALEVLGGVARRVMINGMPVHPEQVERLLNGHPDVADCAVTPRLDDTPPRLAAYVVAALDRRPDGEELRKYLAARRIPDVMVPDLYQVLDALPRTFAGTPDWSALPEFDRPAAKAALAPRTPIEEKIAGIVAELLGAGGVDMSGSFLELGGHSLLAVQLISQVRDELDVELPLRLLYESSLADLAQFVFGELLQADSAGAGTR